MSDGGPYFDNDQPPRPVVEKTMTEKILDLVHRIAQAIADYFSRGKK